MYISAPSHCLQPLTSSTPAPTPQSQCISVVQHTLTHTVTVVSIRCKKLVLEYSTTMIR
jgi:hypothetical protein